MSDSLGEKLTAATPILVLGAGLFALFSDVGWWWMIFVFGWVVLTPLVAILFGDDDGDVEVGVDVDADEVETEVRESIAESVGASDGPRDRQDALDLLRERYAAGELTDAEFERKVGRLLETETLEEAEALLGDDRAGGRGDPTAGEPARDVDYDR